MVKLYQYMHRGLRRTAEEDEHWSKLLGVRVLRDRYWGETIIVEDDDAAGGSPLQGEERSTPGVSGEQSGGGQARQQADESSV